MDDRDMANLDQRNLISSGLTDMKAIAKLKLILLRWSMEIPTHGGKIYIALLSEAIADIEHGYFLALNLIERFKRQYCLLILSNGSPI
jgi:hypothetical protein